MDEAKLAEIDERRARVLRDGTAAGALCMAADDVPALVAEVRRLTAALREAHVARQQPAPDDVKKALKKSHHDALAFTAEVLDGLVASGVTLPPVARLCLDECNDSLPRGYRIAWRAKDFPHKRDAALAR